MVIVLSLDQLGDVDRGRTRCYAMAPTSCMLLNLALRYKDVINCLNFVNFYCLSDSTLILPLRITLILFRCAPVLGTVSYNIMMSGYSTEGFNVKALKFPVVWR
jgi:hypothetical protein